MGARPQETRECEWATSVSQHIMPGRGHSAVHWGHMLAHSALRLAGCNMCSRDMVHWHVQTQSGDESCPSDMNKEPPTDNEKQALNLPPLALGTTSNHCNKGHLRDILLVTLSQFNWPLKCSCLKLWCQEVPVTPPGYVRHPAPGLGVRLAWPMDTRGTDSCSRSSGFPAMVIPMWGCPRSGSRNMTTVHIGNKKPWISVQQLFGSHTKWGLGKVFSCLG